jgi:hypothetical protein
MFFGAGLLFIILRIAYPSVFVNVAEVNEIPGSLGFAFINMFKPENLFSIWTLIVILIVVFICPHMHMSWADVKGATTGAITLILATAGMSLATVIMSVAVKTLIQGVMNTFVTYYIYALILGLIASIIMTICFGLVSLIRGKGL